MDFLNEIFPTLEYPLQEGTRECFKKQGKFYLFKLNRIESESYCGEVFNLCVDEDETYSAGGVVVHNCFDWQVSCCNNKPTYKACLTEITPEAVMVQVEALLKETKFSKQSEKPC